MSTAEAVEQVTAATEASAELPPLLGEQWLELARAGGRTTLETLRAFLPALELADRAAHMPFDLLRHAIASNVLVNVDVDVNVASRPAASG